jgi:hypothetical protein
VVTTDNGTNLDFMDVDGEIAPQHYAFLVTETEFDEIFGRVRARSLPYWADPAQTQPGEINHHDDGRGFYFKDPDGHITRPTAAVAITHDGPLFTRPSGNVGICRSRTRHGVAEALWFSSLWCRRRAP